jgi:antitoxin component YwqK of YwqJK toxin-antitoxin module
MDDDILIDYDDEGLYPPDGFTGVWEVYWPNRKLKWRAHFLNGVEDGRHTCWWDDGRLAQTGICEHGECKGVWVDYHTDGSKMKETEYATRGNFVVRWYDNEGAISEVQTWVNGVQIDK